MERESRSLTASEQRMLKGRLATLKRRGRRIRSRTLSAAAGVCGLLLALTLVASDDPWWIPTLFWLAVAAILALWVSRGERRRHVAAANAIESALRANQAIVTRVKSESVAEVIEEEDEGACWLFQLRGDRLLVLSGQEYYATPRFPSDDFSLVRILCEDGSPYETVLKIEGVPLPPSKRIPSSARLKLPLSDEPQLIPGTITTAAEVLGLGGAA